ncbi:hypothetical protein BC629DRAFT_1300144, partial [Irpex lacteus]
IVAKRCFIKSPVAANEAKIREHLPTTDELPLIMSEAVCMKWATALMDETYKFMAQKESISSSYLHGPSLTTTLFIPKLRFVYSAVAFPSSRKGPVYLLEEAIGGKFCKYILNNSLSPMPGLEGGELQIANFLCFVHGS